MPPSNIGRRLNWEGCKNIRDLGGLPAAGGQSTRPGAVVRSDDPSLLTAAGWAALYAYGIRTIIALRTEGKNEDMPDAAPRPADLTTIEVAIEDLGDREFVQHWVETDLWCTPLYYRDALLRWPERHATAVAAVAQAGPGGVLIHCGRGNDRTGILAMLLLALAGVPPEVIAEDYEMSPDPLRTEILADRGTTAQEVIRATLEGLDVKATLRAGGVSQTDLEALRARLLGPAPAARRP